MTFDAEALATEFATRQRAGDLFALAAGGLGILPDPDPILRASGEDAAILADLVADEQVTTAMLSRKYRVLNQQNYAYSAGAAGQGEPDAAASRLCGRLVQDMERWSVGDVLAGLLDAPFYGFAALELLWRPDGDWWHLADVIPRPQEWFGFDDHNDPVWRGSGGTPLPLPPGKFVFARHFPSYRNPYGLRLLSRCLWPVAFKKGGIRFYVNFAEKYGTPWAVATAPRSATSAEKRAIAQDLARMVQDAVAVIPSGASIQLHAAAGQVGDLHERFLRRWDAAISKVLMGQTLTAELDGKGSYAAAETHKGVADDIAEADRRLIEGAMNEIAWIYAQINDPSALAPTFAYVEGENLALRADLDEKLTKIGARFTAAHFEQTYKLDPAAFETAPPPPPSAFSAQTGGKDAALEAQETLAGAVEQAMPAALASASAVCGQVEEQLAGAGSWDDARALLDGEREIETGALEEALARMMTAGAVFGAASVKKEDKP